MFGKTLGYRFVAFDSSFDSNQTVALAKVAANTISATVGATMMISAFRRVSIIPTHSLLKVNKHEMSCYTTLLINYLGICACIRVHEI
jgi:hypothetical protein